MKQIQVNIEEPFEILILDGSGNILFTKQYKFDQDTLVKYTRNKAGKFDCELKGLNEHP